MTIVIVNGMIFDMHNVFPKTIDDIPMGHDASSRHVCWIVGLMVYLLCLVLIGAMSISSSLKAWHGGGMSRLTVEIPLQGVQYPERLIQNIAATLQAMPGVTRVSVVDNRDILALLQPWTGQVNFTQGLVLPALIDVDLHPDAPLNIPQLTIGLRQHSAGIRIEDHSRWEQILHTLRLSLQVISYLFMSLIMATVMITITLITCSSLATHLYVIDVLRLIGANNSYIAHKFQKRAFWLALKGGLWGVILALPTIYGLNWFSLQLGVPDVLKPTLGGSLLIIILALPFAVGGISFVVARFSVLKTLAKLR
jgi:cell division transport system permease protein